MKRKGVGGDGGDGGMVAWWDGGWDGGRVVWWHGGILAWWHGRSEVVCSCGWEVVWSHGCERVKAGWKRTHAPSIIADPLVCP